MASYDAVFVTTSVSPYADLQITQAVWHQRFYTYPAIKLKGNFLPTAGTLCDPGVHSVDDI